MASGVASVVNWFQRTVPWSNTGRAWMERVAFVGLVAATVALILYGERLALWSYVLAWGGLLVLFGFLLRQGWVFLFGPVLFYDLVRSARRTRTFVIRFVILLLLFGLLCWLYWLWWDKHKYRETTSQDIAEFTQLFFVVFLSVQLVIVVLLTPAYVAGAISEEKERKTIEYILATDLRNREVVLGKYVARLLHLSMLILAGLPILSAVQFMGGIDPNLLLAGYAGTALTMVSIAGVSMFASTVSRRTRDAILIVYLAILTFFGLWGLAEALNGTMGGSQFPSTRHWQSPVTVGDVCQAFAYLFRVGNPGYAIYQVTKTGTVVGSVVWSVLEEYAIFHASLAAIGVLGSIALLRRSALATPKPAVTGRTWMGLGTKRRLPKVGNYPMIWKEVFAERGFRLHILLRILFVLLVILSIVPLLFIFYFFLEEFGFRSSYYGRSPWDMLAEAINGYVRAVGMLVAMLGLIGVAVRAATSVRGEHDKETLDGLLTSPMSSEEILFGKWLGSIFSVRWVAVWLLFIWGVGVVTGGMNMLMLPLLIIAWLVYLAATASLGLWFSVNSRSSLAAILKTLFTGLLLGCGHWLIWLCCIPLELGMRGSFEDVTRTIAEIQAGLTPPAVMAILPFTTEQLTSEFNRREMVPIKLIIFSMGGAFCWGIFAWGVWQATNERFKRLTARGGKKTHDPFPRATVLSSWPEK